MTPAELINDLAEEAHRTALEKGWYDGSTERNDAELLCLIHSELSECLEALRKGNPLSAKLSGAALPVSQAEEELADAVIRILDMAARNDWNLGDAIVAKMAYNRSREPRHGGKRY